MRPSLWPGRAWEQDISISVNIFNWSVRPMTNLKTGPRGPSILLGNAWEQDVSICVIILIGLMRPLTNLIH